VEIHFSENRLTELRDVQPFLFELLKEIVVVAGSTDPRVEARFFPLPIADGDESGLADDWNAYVQPGLQDGFREARDVVQADLRGASARGDNYFLEIAFPHIEAWLSALNQARLAISEEHGFGERELSEEIPPAIGSLRDRALLQMHFYGMLQEWFVRSLE